MLAVVVVLVVLVKLVEVLLELQHLDLVLKVQDQELSQHLEQQIVVAVAVELLKDHLQRELQVLEDLV